MSQLWTINLLRYLSILSASFLLNSIITSANVETSPRIRRPVAEVDPDAIILRTRGNTQDRTSAITTSTSGTSDNSFSMDEPEEGFLLYWNYSSVMDGNDNGQGETTQGLPSQDEGATIEELILRLGAEEALDELQMEDDLLSDALAARRSRPSSRQAAPKRKKKKPKKRTRTRNMYSPLSNKHEERILAMHNAYRRGSPGPSSNMDEMVWDDELRLMSKKYAKKCIWAHGQAVESTTFKHVGQNLAYGRNMRGITMTPFYLVSLWYQEKDNYDISTDTCKPNTLCGHYTQMVWSDTNRLGCATHWCEELTIPGTTITITDALYLVCNYGPGGNVHGHKPYDIGMPCTHCASGSGKCLGGLCSDCDLSESACDCMLECENGGILDEQSCECSCQAGWMGSSCEDTCNNTHPWCGNGWPADWCFNTHDNNPVEDLCPAMCGVCECGGPSCMNGGHKSSLTCQCECTLPWGGEDCSVCDTKCIHGVMVEAACTCACEDGWMGSSCSEPCDNKHQLCYRGWYPNWCDAEHPYVLDNCPAMCGLCKISTGGHVSAGICRKLCKNGGSLDQAACQCNCSPGWFGSDCSLECEDKFHHCRWSTSLCDNNDYARHYCPVSCELCSPPLDLVD